MTPLHISLAFNLLAAFYLWGLWGQALFAKYLEFPKFTLPLLLEAPLIAMCGYRVWWNLALLLLSRGRE